MGKERFKTTAGNGINPYIYLMQHKKRLLSVLFVSLVMTCAAQKHDAVWCFGVGGGIDFNDPQNPVAFKSATSNLEMNASISDSTGNLLFYLKTVEINNSLYSKNQLVNANHQVLQGGDSIIGYSSCTQGAIILPSANKGEYFLFHIASNGFLFCPGGACRKLYRTTILYDSLTNSFIVTKANEELYTDQIYLEERMEAVRHANGEDWWIITHRHKNSIAAPQPNEFVLFQVKPDTVLPPQIVTVGNQYFDSDLGELATNKTSSQMASAFYFAKVVEIYDFNRCNAGLTLIDSVVFVGEEFPYGLEISPNEKYVYITTAQSSFPNSAENTISVYQYNLENRTSTLLSSFSKENAIPGQLERGLNGKIYIAYSYLPDTLFGLEPYFIDSLNSHLGVINSPDSLGLACDFQPFSFPLADSTISFYGLPNFPNYRLGPLSIYTTSAGADTVFCIEDTLPATLTLGQPDTGNLQYTWWPQDSFANPNLAQQTINLPQGADTLQYILSIGDSTITNACTTRDDTVTIILKSCKDDTVGVLPIAQQNLSYTLRPTLIKGQMNALVTLGVEERGQVFIYNLQGQAVYGELLTPGNNTLPVGEYIKTAGLYIYQLWVDGEVKKTDKLVKVQ